jgi:hypothetical protein
MARQCLVARVPRPKQQPPQPQAATKVHASRSLLPDGRGALAKAATVAGGGGGYGGGYGGRMAMPGGEGGMGMGGGYGGGYGARMGGYGARGGTDEGGGYGGGYGSNMMNFTPPKYKLIRFTDLRVTPGRKYRYRVRMYVHDPNHPMYGIPA